MEDVGEFGQGGWGEGVDCCVHFVVCASWSMGRSFVEKVIAADCGPLRRSRDTKKSEEHMRCTPIWQSLMLCGWEA